MGTCDRERDPMTAAEGFAHPQSTRAAGSEVQRVKVMIQHVAASWDCCPFMLFIDIRFGPSI